MERGRRVAQARQVVPMVSLLATDTAACTHFTLGVNFGAVTGHGSLHRFHLNRPLQDTPNPTVVGADKTQNSRQEKQRDAD